MSFTPIYRIQFVFWLQKKKNQIVPKLCAQVMSNPSKMVSH